MGDNTVDRSLEARRAARPPKGGELPVLEVPHVVVELFPRQVLRTMRESEQRRSVAVAPTPEELRGKIRNLLQVNDSLRRQLDSVIKERDAARGKVGKLEAQLLAANLPPLAPKSFWAQFLDHWLGRS